MINTRLTQYLLQRYLLRYPPALRMQRYQALTEWRWLLPSLEQIKPEVLPDLADLPSALTPDPTAPTLAPLGLIPGPAHYSQYRCQIGAPLNCTLALQAVQADPTTARCPICGFLTPLPVGAVVSGDQGQYRLGECLGQRGLGRSYQATWMGPETPVTLREYLLPSRYFNLRDQQQRRDMFLNQVGLTLADGRSQDLRIVAPLEAIAPLGERRAYLVLPVEDQAPTLNTVITQRSPFTEAEVRRVLRQVLQTLMGLHQQRYALSPGRLQTGVIHGNLTLASLLWVELGGEAFVYLTDFALWEDALNPLVIDTPDPTPQTDLRGLGEVAFYLLTGRLTDDTGQRLNPKRFAHWPMVHPPLQHFILRLLGVEAPFTKAEVAYHALLQLLPEPVFSRVAPPSTLEARRRPWWHYLLFWSALLGGLALGGWLLWRLLRPQPLAADVPPPCCFEAVGAVPAGAFVYTATEGDAWEQLLDWQPSDGQTLPLVEQLTLAQPQLQLIYRPANSIEAAIEAVRSRQAAFAILPLLQPLPIDMAAEAIADDGLAVVVAFSYQGRRQSLPDQLGGALSLTQVRDLYQGTLTDWNQVQPSLNLPLELYVNPSPTTLAALEHLVLSPESPILSHPAALAPIPMLRRIIQDFETAGVGSIGVTPLSSITGQCSVYPLAIGDPRDPGSQPLRRTSGQPLQPSVDLCRTKGIYQVDPLLLSSQGYPLAYPIAVVYRRDNRLPPVGRKFAELLLTAEGQAYLQQVNLVPRSLAPD